MTLQASGAISIANISVELGEASTTTHSLNDASFRNLAVVASGAISMSNFYGKANAFAFNATIASNTTDYNIKSAAIAAGWNQVLKLIATITVNAGIYVYASSTGAYGMQTGSTFPAGSTLSVVNNGFILGRGGNGGNCPTVNSANGNPGTAGGPAFLASNAVTITNNGTIGGGGGGGGSAGQSRLAVGIGGGGGGRPLGSGGSGARTGGGAGGAGTLTGAGAGGTGTFVGGAGGGLGAGGATGANSGGAGGAAGACTSGNANITWAVIGTRSGTLG